MADHQFEKNIGQQMAGFKLKPSVEVWQQVEMQLEEDRKRRRWFFYLPIAALLFGGLLFALWPGDKPLKAVTNTPASTKLLTAENSLNEQQLIRTESSTTSAESNLSQKPDQENNIKQQTVTVTQVQQNEPVNSLSGIKRRSANKNALQTKPEIQTGKAAVPVIDKVPAQMESAIDTSVANPEIKHMVQEANIPVVGQSVVITENSTQAIESPLAIDSANGAPSISAPTVIKKKWQIGLHVNAGLSDIRESLFPGTGYKSFSDAFPLGVNNGAPGGVTRIIQYDYAIKPSLQSGVGILLRKPFKKRHSFVTGFQYQYSSYSVTERQRIDSFMTPGNIFRNISTAEKTEKFRMHAFNVPLELEFKIADSKKGTFLFNAGIHNWFLISSTQTDTLSAFRYRATTSRASTYSSTGSLNNTKATRYQPQLYLSPAYGWRGKKTSSHVGVYLSYGLRPAYKSAEKDYWWQTGIHYRIFFPR